MIDEMCNDKKVVCGGRMGAVIRGVEGMADIFRLMMVSWGPFFLRMLAHSARSSRAIAHHNHLILKYNFLRVHINMEVMLWVDTDKSTRQ